MSSRKVFVSYADANWDVKTPFVSYADENFCKQEDVTVIQNQDKRLIRIKYSKMYKYCLIAIDFISIKLKLAERKKKAELVGNNNSYVIMSGKI